MKVYPFKKHQGPAPSLLFLSASSHFSSNHMNLPFGSKGRSRRLKPFPTNKKQGTQGFCTAGPRRVLLGFSPPFSLILLHLEGNRCRTRKGIMFRIERRIGLTQQKTLVLGRLGFRNFLGHLQMGWSQIIERLPRRLDVIPGCLLPQRKNQWFCSE